MNRKRRKENWKEWRESERERESLTKRKRK